MANDYASVDAVYAELLRKRNLSAFTLSEVDAATDDDKNANNDLEVVGGGASASDKRSRGLSDYRALIARIDEVRERCGTLDYGTNANSMQEAFTAMQAHYEAMFIKHKVNEAKSRTPKWTMKEERTVQKAALATLQAAFAAKIARAFVYLDNISQAESVTPLPVPTARMLVPLAYDWLWAEEWCVLRSKLVRLRAQQEEENSDNEEEDEEMEELDNADNNVDADQRRRRKEESSQRRRAAYRRMTERHANPKAHLSAHIAAFTDDYLALFPDDREGVNPHRRRGDDVYYDDNVKLGRWLYEDFGQEAGFSRATIERFIVYEYDSKWPEELFAMDNLRALLRPWMWRLAEMIGTLKALADAKGGKSLRTHDLAMAVRERIERREKAELTLEAASAALDRFYAAELNGERFFCRTNILEHFEKRRLFDTHTRLLHPLVSAWHSTLGRKREYDFY